ncbi:MAG TPA: hypothetical protein VJ729_12555 [Nitrososphaeraceae archaeon]|nr:hypothetical protein [Nitrososphaeraceae archaeon]
MTIRQVNTLLTDDKLRATSRTLFIQDVRSFLVSDVIALIMSAKSALQTCFPSAYWVKKVLCNHTLGIVPFSMYVLESADEFKTKMKTRLQYNNNNNNNNKAKDPILVEHHHLFI